MEGQKWECFLITLRRRNWIDLSMKIRVKIRLSLRGSFGYRKKE